MNKVAVYINESFVGTLEQVVYLKQYRFDYCEAYSGPPVSMTMPVSKKSFEYNRFPPFFDGLLPEGIMLEGLLRQEKIDANDYFNQLIAVGNDLVGAVSIRAYDE